MVDHTTTAVEASAAVKDPEGGGQPQASTSPLREEVATRDNSAGASPDGASAAPATAPYKRRKSSVSDTESRNGNNTREQVSRSKRPRLSPSVEGRHREPNRDHDTAAPPSTQDEGHDSESTRGHGHEHEHEHGYEIAKPHARASPSSRRSQSPPRRSPSPTTGLKRVSPLPSVNRQDSTESMDAQSTAGAGGRAGNAASRTERRRKSGQLEERRRGQRLFGALLGTLSQSGATPTQKRRADIERKQQAKLRLQAEELDAEKARRKEELVKERRGEQVRVGEMGMRVKHAEVLATAHFLHTRTEPKLYYKPWLLREEEKDIINDQIADAEDLVAREREEFAERRRQQVKEEKEREEEDKAKANGPRAQEMERKVEPMSEEPAIHEDAGHGESAKDNSTANGNEKGTENMATLDPKDKAVHEDGTMQRLEEAELSQPFPAQEVEKDAATGHQDDAGDVVLEAEEDTVIY
ncbi:pinin/SDK/memA/ protein conserved region-domain-containing protein [Lineolata rhizophorae]|uniref:Pinin/SDK/memA/ protein conserved region-domain-containing protein n=1 Tax=Lineolata rhizophorae TaxID=578093 RepID=A0A6A6NYC1_9PEZI|nr:pinin/SDK/memA/ protein conserved region-domain-containing protein [Lineolata rhizophorae]